MKKYNYIFGPVLSRRFGRSLGIDLVKAKTCTMDCSFCQLGHTISTTTTLKEYAPVNEVKGEINDWLASGGTADYITLSGSGEPTLHSKLGEIIDHVHGRTSIPVLLLTNSSLLHLPAVRSAAARADAVKVSLSAWDSVSFRRINHPDRAISFGLMVKGLLAFRKLFKGQLWMEVFLIRGLNSSSRDAARIARLAAKIKPDRIQLNTAIRPPADKSVAAVPGIQMARLAKLFTPVAETIGNSTATQAADASQDTTAILALLRRHACTAGELARAFGTTGVNMTTIIKKLYSAGLVKRQRMKKEIYYSI